MDGHTAAKLIKRMLPWFDNNTLQSYSLEHFIDKYGEMVFDDYIYHLNEMGKTDK